MTGDNIQKASKLGAFFFEKQVSATISYQSRFSLQSFAMFVIARNEAISSKSISTPIEFK
jgi:hypothetical protein